MGHDTRPSSAVVDSNGRTLFFPRTGGIDSPRRHELRVGATLFRFAAGRLPVEQAVTGGWWAESGEFQKMSSFAQHQGVSIVLAARLLCCVPPEWSDMRLLMRATVREPLLAYRGLGASVRIAAEDGLGDIQVKAHNDIAARRLNQLYIPGLRELAAEPSSRVLRGALHLEQSWKLSEEQSSRGWLYT